MNTSNYFSLDHLPPPVPHHQGRSGERSHYQEQAQVSVEGSGVLDLTKGHFPPAGLGGRVDMEMFLVKMSVKEALPDVGHLTL